MSHSKHDSKKSLAAAKSSADAVLALVAAADHALAHRRRHLLDTAEAGQQRLLARMLRLGREIEATAPGAARDDLRARFAATCRSHALREQVARALRP